MKKLMRRLSKVGDSWQYCSTSLRKGSGGVPEGLIPVDVGEDMERFLVRTELLNHPMFAMLLNESEQEYGYGQKGVLRIPCHVHLFQRVLETLRIGAVDTIDVQFLLNSPATTTYYYK